APLDQNIDCSERRVKPREHLSRTQVRLPADRGSAVNLLGLGANATLVLIDGRRQVTYPFAQFGTEGFVDLNSIPIAAVDRIEYLKDGASAIYGSDAIAGVVNIILKDEYEGADLKFYFGSTSRGDYQVYHLSAVTGLSEKLGENSKFSLLATFDYYDQSPVLSEDRTYSSELQHEIWLVLRPSADQQHCRLFWRRGWQYLYGNSGNPRTADHAERLYYQWSFEFVAYGEGY